jgi:hypothetical protein
MDAELGAVGVGQDDARDLALLHVQGGRAELEEPSGGGRKVVHPPRQRHRYADG